MNRTRKGQPTVVHPTSTSANGEQSLHRARRQRSASRAVIDPAFSTEIVGSSPAIKEMIQRAQRVATDTCSVLLLGETGTGKEELARAIHRASGRLGSFVAVNCASLSAELAESELFGYVKGAFTSAFRDREGLVTEAENGTLFLDEVGELSLTVQAKFLRFLQERTVRPVGGKEAHPVDVRIIAATNRDLSPEGSAERFRQDLYYRLAEYTIHLPSLRERGHDCLLIAAHFLERLNQKYGSQLRLGSGAQLVLKHYHWPGNVRELQMVVRKVFLEAKGDRLMARQIRTAMRQGPTRSLPVSLKLLQLLELEEGLGIEQLCLQMQVGRSSIYRVLDPLLETGQVERIRIGRQVFLRRGPTFGQAENIELLQQYRQSQLEQSQEFQVLKLARLRGGISRGELMKRLGLPPRTASRLLSQLEEQGRLRHEGGGRASRYFLVEGPMMEGEQKESLP